MGKGRPTKKTARRKPSTAWERARAFGCDMHLLEDCMRRTPAERMARHQACLDMIVLLRDGVKSRREKSRQYSQAAE